MVITILLGKIVLFPNCECKGKMFF